MTRLAEAGVAPLEWVEDEDGTISVTGHQEYEIGNDDEIAVFHGDKCVKILEAVDLPHAVSMVLAAEAVCSYNKRNGCDFKNRAIDEWGCVV